MINFNPYDSLMIFVNHIKTYSKVFSSTCIAALVLVLVSCHDYSSQIGRMQETADSLRNEVPQLQDALQGISDLLSEVKTDGRLVSFFPIFSDSRVIGYIASFADGGVATLYNMPAAVVAASHEGEYYWQVNGQWLTDKEDHKVPVAADVAPAPQFKVVEGEMFVSFDSWLTQTSIGHDAVPLLSSVSDYEDRVEIVLSSGDLLTLYKAEAFEMSLDRYSVEMRQGECTSVSYRLEGAPEGTIVSVACDAGMSVAVTPSDNGAGTLNITALQDNIETEILVFASDMDSRSVCRSIKVHVTAAQDPVDPEDPVDPVDPGDPGEPDEPDEPDDPVGPVENPIIVPLKSSYLVGQAGGLLDISFYTNVEYDVICSERWIRPASTKALRTETLAFEVDPNNSVYKRSATITLSKDEYSKSVTVTQSAETRKLTVSPISVTLTCYDEGFSVAVNSNVVYDVEVTQGGDWCSVQTVNLPSEGTVRFTTALNENKEPRTAKIKFCDVDGIVSRTVTVTQDQFRQPVPTVATGKDIYTSTGSYQYRYGPSIIMHDDGTIEAWFARTGQNSVVGGYMCKRTGSQKSMTLEGRTVAQYFNVQHSFKALNIYRSAGGNATVKLYKWKGSYDATVASAPLATKSGQTGKTLIVNLDSKDWLRAGEYLWTMTDATDGCSVYYYTGDGTDCLTDARSYVNGELQSGLNFFGQVRGKVTTGNGYNVDRFTYRKSTDGGNTWSKEQDALFSTEGTKDSWSVCDPGAAYFDGWYYLGYTSTENTDGYDNHAYVCRSKSPVGPWYKWNGSGWGGDPEPVVKYTGPAGFWGVGEPSIVVVDDTIYFYYTWAELDMVTYVATAPRTEDWPAHLTLHGLAIPKTSPTYLSADSADIKYVEQKKLFYAFHTYMRMTAYSKIGVWCSEDGLNFTFIGDVPSVPKVYVHNMGVSGDGMGHIDLTRNQFMAFAYAADPSVTAKWNTYWCPMFIK